MSWLYGQTWLWYFIAFLVGLFLAWLLLVRPQQRRLAARPSATAPSGDPASPGDRPVTAGRAAAATAAGGAAAYAVSRSSAREAERTGPIRSADDRTEALRRAPVAADEPTENMRRREGAVDEPTARTSTAAAAGAGAVGIGAAGAAAAAAETERPETERPETERPESERPESERPESERPESERTETERTVALDRAPGAADEPTEAMERAPGTVPGADERTESFGDGAAVRRDPPTESFPALDPDAPTEVIPAVDPALSTLDTAAFTTTEHSTNGHTDAGAPVDVDAEPHHGAPVVALEENGGNGNGATAVHPADDAPHAAESLIPDEPIRDEPIRDEPIRDEPIRDEPIRDEPIRDEPIRDEPIRSEPIRSEPGPDLTKGAPQRAEAVTEDFRSDALIPDDRADDRRADDRTEDVILDEPIPDDRADDRRADDRTEDVISDEPIPDMGPSRSSSIGTDTPGRPPHSTP